MERTLEAFLFVLQHHAFSINLLNDINTYPLILF